MTDTMMEPEEAFDMYRSLIEENDQALPMLLYASEQGLVALALAIEFDEGTGMQSVLQKILPGAYNKFGPAKWVIFSSEAHYQRFDKEEDLQDVGQGELQTRANLGESIPECSLITGVSPDKSWTLITPFVRGAEGNITWDEHQHIPAVGGVPDLLMRVVE